MPRHASRSNKEHRSGKTQAQINEEIKSRPVTQEQLDRMNRRMPGGYGGWAEPGSEKPGPALDQELKKWDKRSK